ncbi:hypothetical protein SAMN05216271_1536 [Halopseudomonas sabulinigri]|uniref:CDP-Glycerol:Poly(Glycerophosphate) glycerophosphotransferase n=1 Tax=Halopseudomonas sabulinigri TaxID=472181 RepID=A0A1H1QT43_9GAMM|nr:hypothetical protein [Halopseudomonas sabulinigri]SDS26641.1 hypothetical protein SAMN05216271_1536 [Halopseudomonas sabulinigri]
MANKTFYFSKMFQAVPHLAQVAEVLPGTFVTTRRSTLTAVRRLYPGLATAYMPKYLGPFSSGVRGLKQADVIVTGSPYRSFLEPYSAKKATVFHGTYMMLSREALLRNTHFDLLCTIGPRMQDMIGRFSDVSLNTVQTGFLPFCEYPEQSTQQRTAVLAGMGLEPQQKTVLYTPSRRGLGSWNRVAEQLVRTAPPSLNLVLRPHPSQSLTSRKKDRESFARVQRLIEQRKHAYLDLGTRSLADLVSVADLVVSDANSPSEESLFFDVPQLFIETDDFSQDVLRSMGLREQMYLDDLERLLTLYDCGPRMVIDASPDFSDVLENAIADANTYAERRNIYFSWVFGQRDRLANHRVANAIQHQFY